MSPIKNGDGGDICTSTNAFRIGLQNRLAGLPEAGRIAIHTMSSTPPTPTGGDVPQGLHTAEEIAEVLKVDPKTVLNWAKDGIIPEAFRVGRTVRFSLDAVKEALDLDHAVAGRRVELAVLALRLVFGLDSPRLPKLNIDKVTMEELAEVKSLCAIYKADLEDLKTPQERFAYAQRAADAAELLAQRGYK
jgi:excisionase family DNA binding protein